MVTSIGYFLKDKGMDLSVELFMSLPMTQLQKKQSSRFQKLLHISPLTPNYSLIPSAMVKVLSKDVLR